MTPRIAVLDDYQNIARSYAGWDRLQGRAEVTMFADHLADEDALVDRLAPFSAVALMRERTPFPRRVIERLPNLKLIATSGMWNAAVDLEACEERGIAVVRYARQRWRNGAGDVGADPRARATDHGRATAISAPVTGSAVSAKKCSTRRSDSWVSGASAQRWRRSRKPST